MSKKLVRGLDVHLDLTTQFCMIVAVLREGSGNAFETCRSVRVYALWQ